MCFFNCKVYNNLNKYMYTNTNTSNTNSNTSTSAQHIHTLISIWLIDDHLYSAILWSTVLSRLTALACGSTWVTSFIACFWISTKLVFTVLAWLVPHETAAVSVQVLCTPYNHAPCHFMQSHIRKVYACLAVTCLLHFWQNDRDLLRATAVTQGSPK